MIISAFLRALRDPFPPARMAGINALCGTLEYTPVKECATRVLPTLCTMTVDPEKSVRDQVSKAKQSKEKLIDFLFLTTKRRSESMGARDCFFSCTELSTWSIAINFNLIHRI